MQLSDLTQPLPVPAHLRDMLEKLGKKGASNATILPPASAEGGMIIEGGRNQKLFKLGMGLHHKGLPAEAVLNALLSINKSACNPPLDEEEVVAIAASVARYTADIKTTFIASDYQNAERFVESQEGDIRYCFTRKNWFIWNGKYWEEDKVKAIIVRIANWLKILAALPQSADEEEEKNLKKLRKHAIKSQSKARLEATEVLARSLCPMKINWWNSDSRLLNLQNGTYNLGTHALQSHNKADCITYILGYEYDPKAQCPAFEGFLKQISGSDEGMADFITTLMGYTLLGHPVEQKAFFFYGNGSNGKTTLVELILKLLGDYGLATQPSTFVHHRGGGNTVRNDLAALNDKRFVSSPEINDGDRLDETLFKQITGMDTLSARYLYAELFSFKARFVLVFTANNLPQVKGVDEGIWRRITVVPFTVHIPEAAQDKKLLDKCIKELPGIFNLALRGVKHYRKQGLKLTEAMRQANEQYRKEENKLEEFIEEYCTKDTDLSVRCSDFHVHYEDWSKRRNYHGLSRKIIRPLMNKYGYRIVKTNGVEHYKGIDVNQGALGM